MEKFYVIESDGLRFGTRWAYGDDIPPINLNDCQYCPVCGQPVTSLKWLPPYRVKLSSADPEKWGDLLWGSGFALMVSAKFKGIYEKEGLTGIKEFSQPAEIVRVGKLKTGIFPTMPPDYYLIDVPWDGANQDDIASEVEWYGPPREQFCPYHNRGHYLFRKQKRIVIEAGSWKGDDIFKARQAPAPFIATEHFKQIVDKYRLKNLLLIPADKYGYDDNHSIPWFIQE